MRKLMVLIMLLLFVGGSPGSAMSKNGSNGSAPNSGDGISDGSGWD